MRCFNTFRCISQINSQNDTDYMKWNVTCYPDVISGSSTAWCLLNVLDTNP